MVPWPEELGERGNNWGESGGERQDNQGRRKGDSAHVFKNEEDSSTMEAEGQRLTYNDSNWILYFRELGTRLKNMSADLFWKHLSVE